MFKKEEILFLSSLKLFGLKADIMKPTCFVYKIMGLRYDLQGFFSANPQMTTSFCYLKLPF